MKEQAEPPSTAAVGDEPSTGEVLPGRFLRALVAAQRVEVPAPAVEIEAWLAVSIAPFAFEEGSGGTGTPLIGWSGQGSNRPARSRTEGQVDAVNRVRIQAKRVVTFPFSGERPPTLASRSTLPR